MTQPDYGATAVITHHVAPGKQDQYEEWLKEIGPISQSSIGNLDWQVIRPIAGLTSTYTVIIRFDTEQNLRQWMFSEDRKRLVNKARPFLTTDDHFHIRSGLDFLFTPEGTKAAKPWKQFLVTWSVIYPLGLCVPILLLPVFRWLGFPQNHYLDQLCISGIMVWLVVYIIMPRYMKLIRKWMFK